MAEVTRAEYLAWCKRRAHDYLDVGDVKNAVASMMSDLAAHPETRLQPGPALNALSMLGVQASISDDPEQARRYIDGFN